MKRKIAVMCVLALTGTMMLTACGNKKDSNNGKTSDGKTAIRFATWDVADDVDAQQKLVDKFLQHTVELQLIRRNNIWYSSGIYNTFTFL